AGAWQIAAGESVLGGILAEEGRYAEAEPLLVAGWTRLQHSPGERTLAAQIALRRLVDVYAGSGKPAQAAEYRKFHMKRYNRTLRDGFARSGHSATQGVQGRRQRGRGPAFASCIQPASQTRRIVSWRGA